MKADDDVREKEVAVKIRSAVKAGVTPNVSPWG